MVTELNLSDLTNISLMSVFSAWGLDDGSRLEKFVDDRLYEKTGRRAMTINGRPNEGPQAHRARRAQFRVRRHVRKPPHPPARKHQIFDDHVCFVLWPHKVFWLL